MIRVTVTFPPTAWAEVAAIRAAGRSLAGLPGLVEVMVATRDQEGAGIGPGGPVAELAFEDADGMGAAMAGEAWRLLLGAVPGAAPAVRAYTLRGVGLAGAAGGVRSVTDVELAADEAADVADAEPLSTQLHLPLSRPPQPDERE